MSEHSSTIYLLSGASAGIIVDIVLFPLDTIKTRLQSANGFFRTGGFRGIYSGILSTALGSAPNSAVFFFTYESVKNLLGHVQPSIPTANYMIAATCGETMACLIRVPVEVVKQRAQASPHVGTLAVFRQTVSQEGIRGLYRGYLNTISREIPFALIQFSLWEFFKKAWSDHQGTRAEPWQASMSGALAGGIAAAVTTPLDVAKTRVMLAEKGSVVATSTVWGSLRKIYVEEGVRGLFAGVVPRVMWISVGGAIFLGVYDKVKHTLEQRYISNEK